MTAIGIEIKLYNPPKSINIMLKGKNRSTYAKYFLSLSLMHANRDAHSNNTNMIILAIISEVAGSIGSNGTMPPNTVIKLISARSITDSTVKKDTFLVFIVQFSSLRQFSIISIIYNNPENQDDILSIP